MTVEADNPFNPGYGEQPPFLAGRSELINDAIGALRAGPGRAQFHRILIGPRGAGKTVALNAIVNLAVEEYGAVVLRWTAGSRPLHEAVDYGATVVERALQSRWRRAGGAVDTTATVGVPGVATATASRRPRSASTDSAFTRFDRLARLAARKHRIVVVWIDEAQQAQPDEIATLAAVMQELANVQSLPVAILAAGLPSTRSIWLDAASSLERQEFTTIGNLDANDTEAAFAIPIRETRRQIEDAALHDLVQASRGFPYAIQLIGAATWDATDADVIDGAAVRIGIADALATLEEQVFTTRWRHIPSGHREYLQAAADLVDRATGIVAPSAIAERLGKTTAALSTRRTDLINEHQVLASAGRDQLTFTQPGFAEWVRAAVSEPHQTDQTGAGQLVLDGWNQPPPQSSGRRAKGNRPIGP